MGPPEHQPSYMLRPPQLQPGVHMQASCVGFHLHAGFSKVLPSPKQAGEEGSFDRTALAAGAAAEGVQEQLRNSVQTDASGRCAQTGPPAHTPLYLLRPSHWQPGVHVQPSSLGFHLHAGFSHTVPSPRQVGSFCLVARLAGLCVKLPSTQGWPVCRARGACRASCAGVPAALTHVQLGKAAQTEAGR